MKQEDEEYFQSDEFLDILNRYEQSVCTGRSPYMDSDELIDVADYYMSQGKHKEAKQATELALELHPDAEDPVTMMADIMFETQQWEDSIVWLNKVLDNNPFDVQAWLNITDSQLQCEQFADALDSAEYTLAIQPDNLQALMQKAYAMSRQERYQEASEIFTQYLERCPDDDLALYHAAFNLCFLEQFQEANEMLIKAEEISQGLSPEHLNICLQRSYTEARIGNMQEALDALERSKEFCDSYTNVDYNLLEGHVYLLFQYKEKALECFSRSLSNSEDHIHTMRTIAQVFMDCKEFQTASQILKEIEDIVQRPEYAEAKYDIMKAICPAQAYCFYQMGNREDFIYYLQMSVITNPKDTQIFFRDIFPQAARPEDYMFYANDLE